MEADDLLEAYEENEDDIKQWLWDHDQSDPVKDLLRNTGPVTMFYSLGVEVGEAVYNGYGYSYGQDSLSMATYKVRRALGITKDDPASRLVDSIVANSPYGGELKIYFEAEIADMVSGENMNPLRISQTSNLFSLKANILLPCMILMEDRAIMRKSNWICLFRLTVTICMFP